MDITFERLAQMGSELMAANLANLKNPALTGPGLDDVAFDRMYGFGFRLLASDQYEQALSVFSFLFAQRPTEPRVLSGFGHSLYGLGDVGQAAMMHSLAYSAEPDNRHAQRAQALVASVAVQTPQAAEAALQVGLHPQFRPGGPCARPGTSAPARRQPGSPPAQ